MTNNAAPIPLSLHNEEDQGNIEGGFLVLRRDVVECFQVRSNGVDVIHLRCCFCRNANHQEGHRAPNSTFKPRSVGGLYRAFLRFEKAHFGACVHIPEMVRAEVALARLHCRGRRYDKKYWAVSAQNLGLRDHPDGIVLADIMNL